MNGMNPSKEDEGNGYEKLDRADGEDPRLVPVDLDIDEGDEAKHEETSAAADFGLLRDGPSRTGGWTELATIFGGAVTNQMELEMQPRTGQWHCMFYFGSRVGTNSSRRPNRITLLRAFVFCPNVFRRKNLDSSGDPG
jgi:hypothetical protein